MKTILLNTIFILFAVNAFCQEDQCAKIATRDYLNRMDTVLKFGYTIKHKDSILMGEKKGKLLYMPYFSYNDRYGSGFYFDYLGVWNPGRYFLDGKFDLMPDNETVALGFKMFSVKTGKFIGNASYQASDNFSVNIFEKKDEKWIIRGFQSNIGGYSQSPNYRYVNGEYLCICMNLYGEKLFVISDKEGKISERRFFEADKSLKANNTDDLAQLFSDVIVKKPIDEILSVNSNLNLVSSLFKTSTTISRLFVSPKGNLLAGIANEGTIDEIELYLFAAAGGDPRKFVLEKPIMILKPGKVSLIKFTYDNRYMLIENKEGTEITIWDLTTGNNVAAINGKHLAKSAGNPAYPNYYAFALSSKIEIYDFDQLKFVKSVSFTPRVEADEKAFFPNIKFSSDGKYLGIYSCLTSESRKEKMNKLAKFYFLDFNFYMGKSYLDVKNRISDLFNLEIDEYLLKTACSDNYFVEFVNSISIVPKNEFETTAEFNKRNEPYLDTLLLKLQTRYEKAYTSEKNKVNGDLGLPGNEITTTINSVEKYDADNNTYQIKIMENTAEMSIKPAEAKGFKDDWWSKAIVNTQKDFSKGGKVPDYVNTKILNPQTGTSYPAEFKNQPFSNIRAQILNPSGKSGTESNGKTGNPENKFLPNKASQGNLEVGANLLIGEWQGPNQVVLSLRKDGTGICDLGPLKCQLRITSWSSTATKLSIHWDMTPINCKKLDSDGTFTHKPKIEFDNPVYTITKTPKSVAGIKTVQLSLSLDNKEYNTSATYFRVEVEEPSE